MASDYLKELENYGIGLPTYQEKHNNTKAVNGDKLNPLDIILEMILDLTKRKPETAIMAYLMAARFLDDQGKDFKDMLRKAIRLEIEDYFGSKVVKSVKINAENCCEVCLKYNDKELSIEAALNHPPLPVSNCTRKRNGLAGFCRCYLETQLSDEPLERTIQVKVSPEINNRKTSKDQSGCLAISALGLIILFLFLFIL